MNITHVRLQGPNPSTGLGQGGAAGAGMSVELGLELTGRRIDRARVLLEGDSAAPVRVGAAEVALEGQMANEGLFQLAADRILEDAQAQAGRGCRIEVGRQALVDGLSAAAFGPKG